MTLKYIESVDAAIASLHMQHALEQANRPEPTSTVIGYSTTPKASKKVAAKRIPAPRNDQPAPIVRGLPEKGTLDAAGFMLAIRNAGKRTVHIVPVVDQGKTRWVE